MNNQSNAPYEIVANLFEQRRKAEALEVVAEHFRQARKYPEMFEALKGSIRQQLDLPVIYGGETEELPPETQQQLEDRLLAACSTVGKLLLQDGQIAESWMYLRPLSNQQQVRELLEAITVDEENVDEVIEVCLYQWAAPVFGYRVLLTHQGTCNGITFFDTQATYQTPKIRNRLAEILTRHVHDELLSNVVKQLNEDSNQVISKQEGLRSLVQHHASLFENCGHHLDVTHLAAVVRIARFCEQQELLPMALALCEYGKRLDPQLHYPGEPPFEQTYEDHLWFFKALSGEEVDQATKHFRAKHEDYQEQLFKTASQMALIELMARTGQSKEAIECAIQLHTFESEQDNEAAVSMQTLIGLAESERDIETLMKYFKSNDDLLGFSLAALQNEKSPVE